MLAKARLLLVCGCFVLGCTPIDALATGESAPLGDDGGVSGPYADAPADALPTTVDGHFDARSSGDSAPACACEPAAPRNWTGPFELYDGNPGNVPPCPSGSSEVLDAFADLQGVPQAQCSACSCDPPAGITASSTVPIKALEATSGINGGTFNCSRNVSTLDLSIGVCTRLPQCTGCYRTQGGSSDTPYQFETPSPPTAGTSCNAHGGAATLPPLPWARAARGCSMIGSVASPTCPTNQVCAIAQTAPFEKNLCVMQSGDVTCPGFPYTQKRLFYAHATETRGCSACSCAPASLTCTAQISYYVGNACSCDPGAAAGATCTCGTVFQTADVPNSTCIVPTVSNPMSSSDAPLPYCAKVTGAACSAGSCTPQGGQPTGTASAKDPITVCCAQ